MPAILLLLLLSGVRPTAAHPESLSRTRILVEGRRATVELRCDALSLLELDPALDASGDGWLDAAEAEAARPFVADYLASHLVLVCEGCPGRETLSGTLEILEPQDPAALGPFDLQKVDVRLRYEAPAELVVLGIESRLFRERNPWHKDFASVVWNGAAPVHHSFEGPDALWRFEPAHVRRPGVVLSFLRLGIDHILSGWDHLAFVLALLVASRRFQSLLGVITAFTLAHSITLAAAALGHVSLPARFVELAIALSIAYVAVENCLARSARNPWIEAFGFGLLHGLGFAGFLGQALAGEPLVLSALLGFNLGVEVGQLAVVSGCMLVIGLVFRGWRRRRTEPALVPRGVRVWSSAAIAVCGLFWFAQRAGWVGWV